MFGTAPLLAHRGHQVAGHTRHHVVMRARGLSWVNLISTTQLIWFIKLQEKIGWQKSTGGGYKRVALLGSKVLYPLFPSLRY